MIKKLQTSSSSSVVGEMATIKEEEAEDFGTPVVNTVEAGGQILKH